MSESNGEPIGKEVLGILYIRYGTDLGPMLGDSAFTDKLFEEVERFVMNHSPWLECSSTIKRVAEGGPAHSIVTFDSDFVPTLTYRGHLNDTRVSTHVPQVDHSKDARP